MRSSPIRTYRSDWWPQTADFSRYKLLLSTLENSEGAAFTSSLRNSIEVAGMATSAAIALAIPAGWAVSRTPSVGWSLSMVIATYMLPPVALVPVLRSRTSTLLPLDFTLHGGRGAGGRSVTGACTVIGPV